MGKGRAGLASTPEVRMWWGKIRDSFRQRGGYSGFFRYHLCERIRRGRGYIRVSILGRVVCVFRGGAKGRLGRSDLVGGLGLGLRPRGHTIRDT